MCRPKVLRAPRCMGIMKFLRAMGLYYVAMIVLLLHDHRSAPPPQQYQIVSDSQKRHVVAAAPQPLPPPDHTTSSSVASCLKRQNFVMAVALATLLFCAIAALSRLTAFAHSNAWEYRSVQKSSCRTNRPASRQQSHVVMSNVRLTSSSGCPVLHATSPSMATSVRSATALCVGAATHPLRPPSYWFLRLVSLWGDFCGDTKGYIPAHLGLFVRDPWIWVRGLHILANSSASYVSFLRKEIHLTNVLKSGFRLRRILIRT